MHAALIINPAAGRGAGRALGPAITAHLTGLGISAHPSYSASADDLMRCIKAALATRPDVVIVVGGDGSVHAAVNGWRLAGGGAPLAVIPVGTGNDFMKMFAVDSDWRAACARIAQGKTRRVDIGKCNDFYFANNLGIGFDARVAMAANRMQWLHSQAVYGVAVARTLLFEHSTAQVRVQHDGKESHVAITLIAINNGSTEGGAFRLAPDAQIDDGLFDVVMARALSRFGILKLVPQVVRGRHLDHPAVTMFKTDKLTIESDTGLPVHADGEIRYTEAKRLELEILPLALTLMV